MAKVHNLKLVSRDRGYRWNDCDPDMEWLTNIISRSELSIGDIQDLVLDCSNNSVFISYNTIANWLAGKTKRPQNWTLTWVAVAMGYERQFVLREDRKNKEDAKAAAYRFGTLSQPLRR